MKTIPRFWAVLLFAVMPFFSFAQENLLEKSIKRGEIATVEEDDGGVTLEVFSMPKDEGKEYFLSVGNLGVGDDIIQFHIDPAFELFLPLGTTLSEAMESLAELQAFYKEPRKSTMEKTGCLALAVPDGNDETVTITSRQILLSRVLEFALQRDGYVRAVHIPRSAFNSLVFSVKMYQKIHPNEP